MQRFAACLSFLGVLILLAAVGQPAVLAAEARPGVEFFLLQDEKLDFEAARKMALSGVPLQAAPWIAAENIERYDWSTHSVYLKKAVSVPRPVGQKHILLRGTPFMVVADGERCYLGALWSPVSSFLPSGNSAIADVVGESLKQLDIKLLSVLPPWELRSDVRFDPAVMKALKSQKQFDAGTK